MRVQPNASPFARLDQLSHGVHARAAKSSAAQNKAASQTSITPPKGHDAIKSDPSIKKASQADTSNTQNNPGGGVCGVGDPPVAPPSLSISSGPDVEEPLTVSGCMKAFGETVSPYDFTQDGIVNVDDLLYMFSKFQWPQAPVQDTSQENVLTEVTPAPTDSAPVTPASEEIEVESPGTSTQAPPATPPAQPDTPLTMSGLLGAFGDTNSAYDFTGDGMVNVDDLIWYINSWQGPGESSDNASPGGGGMAAAQQPQSGPALPTAMTPASKFGDVGRLADMLIDRLTTAGFGEQPPLNIRQLVDKLNLSRGESKQVFNRLSAKYPGGLGVNMVG